jgi:hypothetical protein
MTRDFAVTPITRDLYKGLGFKDRNNSGKVSGEREGYKKEFDANGNRIITPNEAWIRYLENISDYPKVKPLLKKDKYFKYPFNYSRRMIRFTRRLINRNDNEIVRIKKIYSALSPKGSHSIEVADRRTKREGSL